MKYLKTSACFICTVVTLLALPVKTFAQCPDITTQPANIYLANGQVGTLSAPDAAARPGREERHEAGARSRARPRAATWTAAGALVVEET